LSPAAAKLLEFYKEEIKKESLMAAGPTLKVNEVLGSLAFIYERVRNAIDYKGEHLLRRNAIERIIKRQAWNGLPKNPRQATETLIKELVWAHYLKNNSVPYSRVEKVTQILVKYFAFLGQRPDSEWKNWFLGVASCEIEEALSAPNLDRTYVLSMYSWFKANYRWEDSFLTDQEKDIQIFLAIGRAMPKFDETMLRYHLLLTYFPEWSNSSLAFDPQLADRIFKAKETIDAELKSPVKFPLFRMIQRLTSPFIILRELINSNPDEFETILGNPEALAEKIEEICLDKYAQISQKVSTGITRSIIYIFMTKMVFAFLLEVPYELLWLKRINLLPLGINALLPPALMYLMGLTIRVPDERNTEKIVAQIKSFVYQDASGEKTPFSLAPKKQGQFLNTIFLAIYGVVFLLTFGLITMLLLKLHFNIISLAIFFIFLSLILLFGFRIRFTASEPIVTEEEGGFLGNLFDNVTLPFLSLGAWLSRGLAQFNVLMILMDFLIEAPLKSVIAVVGEWANFIKERKKEVVEVPLQS